MKNINIATEHFYSRFRELSQNFHFEYGRQDQTDSSEVLKTLKNMNLNIIFDRKNNIFRATENVNKWEFTLNIILKYGLVECVFSAKDSTTGNLIGGTFGSISKIYERNNAIEQVGYVPLPGFRNIGELNAILKESVLLFELLKENVLKGRFESDK